MIFSTIGLIHVIFACIALLAGTIVLLNAKGNTLHIRIGYVYVVAMLIMNLTGFGIYHLFGHFGIFHVFIFISLVTLFGGMYPILNRKKVKNWYLQHIEFMGWSVVGLYAALVSEMATRLLPLKYMPWVVGIGTFTVTAIGWVIIKRKVKLEKVILNRSSI